MTEQVLAIQEAAKVEAFASLKKLSRFDVKKALSTAH